MSLDSTNRAPHLRSRNWTPPLCGKTASMVTGSGNRVCGPKVTTRSTRRPIYLVTSDLESASAAQGLDRVKVIDTFVRWYLRRPGAKLPSRARARRPEREKAMSIVNAVVPDAPTDTVGLEWGPTLGHAPSIDTAEAKQFLQEHHAWDNADTDVYALVVSDDLWDNYLLNELPCLEIEVPDTEAEALIAAINEDWDTDETEDL
jgi:hypothetical protein